MREKLEFLVIKNYENGERKQFQLTEEPFGIGYKNDGSMMSSFRTPEGTDLQFDNDYAIDTYVGGRLDCQYFRQSMVTPGKAMGIKVHRVPKVSRKHALIYMKDGQRMVQDLGSRTGTFVNGTELPREQYIETNNGFKLVNFRPSIARPLIHGDVIGLVADDEHGFLIKAKYHVTYRFTGAELSGKKKFKVPYPYIDDKARRNLKQG